MADRLEICTQDNSEVGEGHGDEDGDGDGDGDGGVKHCLRAQAQESPQLTLWQFLKTIENHLRRWTITPHAVENNLLLQHTRPHNTAMNISTSITITIADRA